jgi:hypothetical protein
LINLGEICVTQDYPSRWIEDYDNEVANIETAWLREEIVKLRRPISFGAGAAIDSATWKKWRNLAGMYQVDEDGNPVRGSNGEIKASKARQCTQRQAALLVLLALWKPANRPFIKDLINSPLNASQLTHGNIRKLFNQWIEKTGGVEGQPLLEAIARQQGQMTGSDLSDLSEYMTPGKKVPVGNLARLVKEPIKGDRPCSRAATEKIIHWLIDRAHQINSQATQANGQNYSNTSNPDCQRLLSAS